mmetsp:Transcript_30938/g.87659  ORF Transcript_30938/g.87659 Transcript_30938/m.87659 type:complete len:244 (-) Transcript_30938:1798-2529(-)
MCVLQSDRSAASELDNPSWHTPGRTARPARLLRVFACTAQHREAASTSIAGPHVPQLCWLTAAAPQQEGQYRILSSSISPQQQRGGWPPLLPLSSSTTVKVPALAPDSSRSFQPLRRKDWPSHEDRAELTTRQTSSATASDVVFAEVPLPGGSLIVQGAPSTPASAMRRYAGCRLFRRSPMWRGSRGNPKWQRTIQASRGDLPCPCFGRRQLPRPASEVSGRPTASAAHSEACLNSNFPAALS